MSDQKKGVILVVDDEDALRRAVARALEGAGYEVLQASAGGDALRLLEAHAVDMIISDVSMPNMSGFELLRAVKQRTPHVQVILTTGDSNLEDEARASRDGAFCCLAKPVAKAALTEAVTLAINQRRFVLQAGPEGQAT
jgi:DNA-binding NtrC family response regulator